MTLKEFQIWVLNQGSVANPEPNYKYKGQCVSLIQQLLYHVLGIPFKVRGNAKDWAYNADVLSHFNKLSSNTNLTAGDILVYGANYGGGYGHMGFIGSDGKFYDQNGTRSLAVGYRDIPFSGYICVLRSKNGINIGNDGYTTGNYKTLDIMRVRDGVWGRQKGYSELTEDGKKNALSNGCYKKGTIFTAIEIINHGDGSVWTRGYSGYICIKEGNNVYCEKV